VGLVASPTRAAHIIDGLRAAGSSEHVLGRVKAPAGLDLGAVTPAEIALSILAEVVQRRRSGRQALPQLAKDPICGMDVAIESARWTSDDNGRTVYFCSPGCREAYSRAR
jgi:xanthine dehydrogenase accessory factor